MTSTENRAEIDGQADESARRPHLALGLTIAAAWVIALLFVLAQQVKQGPDALTSSIAISIVAVFGAATTG